jgi:spore coat protein U-like protein
MRKLSFALAAVVALPGFASAQTATATINATAIVQSAVTFSNTANLDFGAAIVPGSGATVTPANGGKAMVSYNVPTTITVAGTALSSGGASLPVTYSCAQASTGTNPTPTAFSGSCAGGFTTALSGAAQTSHWIYIGGAILAASTTSAPAGTYTGTVTLTATYTTF